MVLTLRRLHVLVVALRDVPLVLARGAAPVRGLPVELLHEVHRLLLNLFASLDQRSLADLLCLVAACNRQILAALPRLLLRAAVAYRAADRLERVVHGRDGLLHLSLIHI